MEKGWSVFKQQVETLYDLVIPREGKSVYHKTATSHVYYCSIHDHQEMIAEVTAN